MVGWHTIAASDRLLLPTQRDCGHKGIWIFGTWPLLVTSANLIVNIALAQPTSLKNAVGPKTLQEHPPGKKVQAHQSSVLQGFVMTGISSINPIVHIHGVDFLLVLLKRPTIWNPTSASTLLLFAAHLAQSGLAHTSIKIYLSAIGNLHTAHSHHEAYQQALNRPCRNQRRRCSRLPIT